MKPQRIDRRMKPPRRNPTFAFKGQMPFLGPVAMEMKLLRGVKDIVVDQTAWKKLSTIDPKKLELYRDIEIFLLSNLFLDLDLKVFRLPRNPGLIHIMGDPENVTLINLLTRSNEPAFSGRRRSNLLGGE